MKLSCVFGVLRIVALQDRKDSSHPENKQTTVRADSYSIAVGTSMESILRYLHGS